MSWRKDRDSATRSIALLPLGAAGRGGDHAKGLVDARKRGVEPGHRFPHLRYSPVGEDGLHPLDLVPDALQFVRDDREHAGGHLADRGDARVTLDHALAVGRVAKRLLLQTLLDAPQFLADLVVRLARQLFELRRDRIDLGGPILCGFRTAP